MIHAYKLNGYNIILDQNSGCVHSVDPVAYDMITMYQDHDKEEIRRFILENKDQPDVTNADVDLCFKDIEALIADGRLFAEDTFEAVADQFKRRQGVLKAICLHVAHDCNLACKYCFAGKGEYDGQREIMSYEVGKQALDYLIANSPGRRNLEVDFFGGEPLLNWDVCKRLVAYGREQEKLHNKNFRFTLTTNGLLINDDVIDFYNREMGNVVLSLDGRKVTHDRLRVGRNGKGSYDLILDKFKRFADSRGQKDYYMRGTYTHFNTDFAADVLHMADLGFKELSIEPVVCDPKEDYALQESDLPGAIRDIGQGNATPLSQGRRLYFLSLYDRPGRRPLYCQAGQRLRRGHRVYGRDPHRRFVPLSSVCGRHGLLAWQCVRWRDPTPGAGAV